MDLGEFRDFKEAYWKMFEESGDINLARLLIEEEGYAKQREPHEEELFR